MKVSPLKFVIAAQGVKCIFGIINVMVSNGGMANFQVSSFSATPAAADAISRWKFESSEMRTFTNRRLSLFSCRYRRKLLHRFGSKFAIYAETSRLWAFSPSIRPPLMYAWKNVRKRSLYVSFSFYYIFRRHFIHIVHFEKRTVITTRLSRGFFFRSHVAENVHFY
jgi:hypothetical protein